MGADSNLSPIDKLIYLGRVAWSQARLPIALRRLSIAADNMRERAFPHGAVLAREGEPLASSYLLVQGRVRVSRRGTVLGEAEPGALVGFEGLLSQDPLGLGVVAASDVLALQLDHDTLLGILDDQFPLVHLATRAATRRFLELIRRLAGPRHDSTRFLFPGRLGDDEAGLWLPQPTGRRMSLIEMLLFLRTPGGPFEGSSIDALAELAESVMQVPFPAGHVFWREGDRATRIGLVVEGNVACASSRAGAPFRFRVGPGRPLGILESVAGEPRWFDAVAETPGVLLEDDVERLIDLFEDNTDVALDYLAWVSRTTLELIERELGPGRDLLEFFTILAPPLATTLPAVEVGPERPVEDEAGSESEGEHA
jgi:CRP-like cAMP-binding protein